MAGGCRVGVGGPLAPFAAGIEDALVVEGYGEKSARPLLRLVADLSRWLDERGRGAGDLTGVLIEQFFADGGGRRCQRRSPRSLKLIVKFLASLGVVRWEGVARLGRDEVERGLLEAFGGWCIAQRGLTTTTTEQYVSRVAVFLRLWCPDGGVRIVDLDGRAVLATVRAASEVMPDPSLRSMVTALRSFLRFLYVTGRVSVLLVTAVPPLKCWPRTALPAAIPAADARRLVASCDTTTGPGQRDTAVLLVLLRLGLRASEVARLELEDIDWRRGAITIKGKGGHDDVVPVPVEVGEALAIYLQEGRPSSPSRSVFLTVVAPLRPLSCDGVALLVRRACGRAGVPQCGPHRLRHTLATETLRAGAPMAEVAQLLRHADQATSAIYAAADEAAVAAVVRPWPQVV
ncbi:MAG TPA: tyrosine-type recombinase/integrase [Acidimicrobiales bacterium]|nr:tyrosine-type recombinase/integrase [Acidimicrobiales bacterium]